MTAKQLQELYYLASVSTADRIPREKWEQVIESLWILLKAMEEDY